MKRFVIVLLVIGLIGACIWLFVVPSKTNSNSERQKVQQNKKATLPTEQFIINNLLHKDGTIRTDLPQHSRSAVALSESIGLWMEYLAEKEDTKLFDKAYQTIEELFLTKENVVMWKIENGKSATTNALIDDLRIMEALFREGERRNKEEYITTAKRIANGVLKNNRIEAHFVDFFDVQYKERDSKLTLSYVSPTAFQYLVKYSKFSKKDLVFLKQFMQNVPLKNGFYPKSYRISDDSFEFDDTINLIDQLYVAMHMERFDINTESFYAWLKETFYKEDHLYGRYDGSTKKNAVEYESVAVYALTILYSLEREEYTFAKDVYKQMIRHRTDKEDATYYGGYLSSNSTHSFDNLLALLAERKLLDEQVIE
ncbi:lipoprotein YdaJ [Virgibacillus sp. W0430]|uniref:lipoprotein YdaJ n=1 Tax=Virgibacillus sp. W0430 TaxID=3391580 RepID=UPI003F45F5D0